MSSQQSLDPPCALCLDVGDRSLQVADLLHEGVARVLARDGLGGGAGLLRLHALQLPRGVHGLDAEGVRHAGVQFFQGQTGPCRGLGVYCNETTMRERGTRHHLDLGSVTCGGCLALISDTEVLVRVLARVPK